jgi:4-aminobutyrate aminotransferase-like enzyme/Ser/Thr protein kinase RdoA (MazF antagonist)
MTGGATSFGTAIRQDDVVVDPLTEPLPRFEPEEAAALLERYYAIDASPQPLHSERDLNFRMDALNGRRYLLKIHNPADGPAVVDMRTGALEHVARVDPGLPVSRVVACTGGPSRCEATSEDGRTSQVQVFSWLEGRHADRDELGEEALHGWGVTVARLGRALRGYFDPSGRYAIQWDLRQAGSLRPRLGAVAKGDRHLVEVVLDRFDEQVAPRIDALRAQMIHNDLGLENVLVDDAHHVVGITDFGDMTHTALVCDLAVALADVLDGRPDSIPMAEPMIAGFRSVTPLEDAEALSLGDLVATRLATAVVVSAWRRQHHEATPQFPRALEFLRLLEREGFDRVGAIFERFGRGAGGEGAGARTNRRTAELLVARRRVLGPLALSYDEPLHLVRGEGVHLFDSEGRRYLDAYNNVPVLGHCHPAVIEAISRQSGRLVTNTRYLQEVSIELGERLLESTAGAVERVLFVNSGSEANDLAWRIATRATGHSGAVVTTFAYHGITTATTDFSPEAWWPGHAPAHVGLVAPPGRQRRPGIVECLEALEHAGHRPAMLLVDPALTSDGILGPAPDWLVQVSQAVRKAGGLVLGDEVQAGFARTGRHLWSSLAAGLQPDLMTLGKPMGNGFPVAAVMGRAEHVDPFVSETDYFSTFGGNTLACAAALAVLRTVEQEGLVEHAAEVGSYLRSRLEAVASGHGCVAAVRGWGLLFGLEIVSSDDALAPSGSHLARAVANGMRRLGVLVGTTGPEANILKIRPPLVLEPRHANEIADRLDEVLGSLASARVKG